MCGLLWQGLLCERYYFTPAFTCLCARVWEREKEKKRGGGRELRAGGNSCVLECVYPGGDPWLRDRRGAQREREMHVAWGERVSGLLWVHWLSKKSLNGVFDVFVNANITVIGREGTWVFFKWIRLSVRIIHIFLFDFIVLSLEDYNWNHAPLVLERVLLYPTGGTCDTCSWISVVINVLTLAVNINFKFCIFFKSLILFCTFSVSFFFFQTWQ